MCRSRKMLKDAYLDAKIGFDTAEDEPFKACRYLHFPTYLPSHPPRPPRVTSTALRTARRWWAGPRSGQASRCRPPRLVLWGHSRLHRGSCFQLPTDPFSSLIFQKQTQTFMTFRCIKVQGFVSEVFLTGFHLFHREIICGERRWQNRQSIVNQKK